MKPIVVLDLDNTLISSLTRAEVAAARHRGVDLGRMRSSWMDSTFLVFERPRLQEFLDFVFANFRVAVWTAASRSYAASVVDDIVIGDYADERSLEFILFARHCKASLKHTGCIKNLAYLERVYNRYVRRSTPMIIVDDNESVQRCNGQKCIAVRAFDAGDVDAPDDDELMTVVRPMLVDIVDRNKRFAV